MVTRKTAKRKKRVLTQYGEPNTDKRRQRDHSPSPKLRSTFKFGGTPRYGRRMMLTFHISIFGGYLLLQSSFPFTMNFYFQAANVLDRLDAKQGSIKSVVGELPPAERKRTAALVIETLKYRSVLTQLINASTMLRDERKLSSLNLALVLVHDLLLRDGIQAGDGPIKQAVLRHKTRLNGELVKIKIKHGVRSIMELAQPQDARAAHIPRYVRVNTVKWTTPAALQSFLSQGFQLSGPFQSSRGFMQDDHIADLLSFSPQTQFHNDPPYKSGKIILQDKASCFPAVILAPPATDEASVIDATAAPGNKTSHLSALMQNKGNIYAFERDKSRFSTLQAMLSRAGCSNVQARHMDFLSVLPTDAQYASVTHILLDPSCSGSGIVNRLDYLLEDDESEISQERLDKLAAFQLRMIKHAMGFPSVRRIVYSTCSIYAAENEHVVRDSLMSEEARNGRFVLAQMSDVLPSWHRRGLQEELGEIGDASSLVRCVPGEDATNGFFVSCFVRLSEDVSLSLKRRGSPPKGTELRQRPKKRRKTGLCTSTNEIKDK